MNIVKKEPVVVIYKLTDEEINYFLSKRDKKSSNVRKRPERKKKQEASRNLRDVSRVDFTLFENYRRERLKFLNKKARKSKNSPSRQQTTKAASPSVEKQKDRLIAPKPNVGQLLVRPQAVIPQHFTYASYPAQILPLPVFQNQQTVAPKDTLVAKKPINNRKRPAPIDSDSDCDENYGIILSSNKDSTFFMHNYACNSSKQISQSLPRHFLSNQHKVPSVSPPDVLINEHDILSVIALDDPLSKVNISTFPNLNSKNSDLSSSDLRNFIGKESYIGSGFHGGNTLKQNLLGTSPLLRGGSCGPTVNLPKTGMPDTELSSFTSAVKNKLDGVDLLKEFDVVSKIMLEMDAEFNSAHSKVTPPEHELNQPKTVQQPAPVIPNITLPKGMTLTLVEPPPPKGETIVNKQNDKEVKTSTDNVVKVTSNQPKAVPKNDYLVIEKTVRDIVRSMVDEVSSKMYIASLSRTGSKLNHHLQANRSVKRLCARCKCLLVQDSMNRYSCKNCKTLIRVSPKKLEGGTRDSLRNCDKVKPVSGKHKIEKIGSTPNKLWKTLSKYDQNRLSYLKHSLKQNKKNVKVLTLNNSPKKTILISPLREKLEKANSIFSPRKTNSFAHKLIRKNSSSLTQKVMYKDGICVRNKTAVKNETVGKSEMPMKSESSLKGEKDNALKAAEPSEKKQNSASGDEGELGKETTSQAGETTTKKSGVEVKNINRGLFLMTFGEPDAEIDMSAGNNDPVDNENTLASSKRTELPEREKTDVEPEEEQTSSATVEKEGGLPPDSGTTHPLIQKQGINEISCTYVLPQVPSIIVAKYSSDSSQNGDFLLSSVAHIQQNSPSAGLNVVQTSAVAAISGVSQSEALNQTSQAVLQACDSPASTIVPDVNSSREHQEAVNSQANDPSKSINIASASSHVSDSSPANPSVSEKELLGNQRASVISPPAAKSTESVPNVGVTSMENSSKSSTSTPQGNQSDTSLLASMREPLDIRRRNISHELDAVAILSILDLDGSRSRSETLLRSLLDKEFKELKEIRGMKISDLDAHYKNIVAMKMNRVLDTIKSLQLATMLFRQYETLDKVVEAVLKKPSAVKENTPPPNNVCVPTNEKVTAKLEGRQDCRFASCSVTPNVQLDPQNTTGALTNISASNGPESSQLENALNSKIQCKTEASASSSCCMQSGAPKPGSAAANYLERIEKQVSSIAPQALNSSQLPAMLQTYRQFPGGILQNGTNPNVARSMIVQQTPSPVQQMQPSQSPTQRMPSPMQAAQSPIQRMQSPMQPVQSPMQPVQSPLQQVTSPVHLAPSPMHPPQSPMQQNHPLSMPSADEMHRTPSNGSGSRPGSGRPHSTESTAMPLSPASIKKEALSAPSPCSGTVPGSESAASVAEQYSPQLGGNMPLQSSPFPDDVVYSNGMLIHRQAPPSYTPAAPVRSIGPPNRTVPFASQLPFPNMGNNRFGGGYNPMQTVPNPAVGLSNQVALYNQQMTNSGVRVQQVVLPSSNSNLQQLNKPYTQNQVSTVQGNSYTLQTQSTASIVPSTNAMTANTQVVPVQNSLRLAQGGQGTNASTYQTVSQVAQATTQVMQQPNWNKENPASNGNVMFCALCKNMATLRCKQCTKVAFCNTTCAKIYWHHRHKNECKPQAQPT